MQYRENNFFPPLKTQPENDEGGKIHSFSFSWHYFAPKRVFTVIFFFLSFLLDYHLVLSHSTLEKRGGGEVTAQFLLLLFLLTSSILLPWPLRGKWTIRQCDARLENIFSSFGILEKYCVKFVLKCSAENAFPSQLHLLSLCTKVDINFSMQKLSKTNCKFQGKMSTFLLLLFIKRENDLPRFPCAAKPWCAKMHSWCVTTQCGQTVGLALALHCLRRPCHLPRS